MKKIILALLLLSTTVFADGVDNLKSTLTYKYDCGANKYYRDSYNYLLLNMTAENADVCIKQQMIDITGSRGDVYDHNLIAASRLVSCIHNLPGDNTIFAFGTNGWSHQIGGKIAEYIAKKKILSKRGASVCDVADILSDYISVAPSDEMIQKVIDSKVD